MNHFHRYDEIIHLPHPVSQTHPRMGRLERAAQFSPFAALTGYDDAVRETARLTDAQRELAEDEQALLERQLLRVQMLLDAGTRPVVAVTWFQPDAKKQGGARCGRSTSLAARFYWWAARRYRFRQSSAFNSITIKSRSRRDNHVRALPVHRTSKCRPAAYSAGCPPPLRRSGAGFPLWRRDAYRRRAGADRQRRQGSGRPANLGHPRLEGRPDDQRPRRDGLRKANVPPQHGGAAVRHPGHLVLRVGCRPPQVPIRPAWRAALPGGPV